MAERQSESTTTGFGWICSEAMTRRDAENLRRFNAVTLVWALTFVGATLAIVQWDVSGAAGWALATATLLLGGVSMAFYMKFLRDADELLRKIHVEALGLGFGASIVFMLFWRLCERLGAPKLDVVDPVLVMVVFWAAGQFVGLRRYRAESAE